MENKEHIRDSPKTTYTGLTAQLRHHARERLKFEMECQFVILQQM